MLFTNSIAIHNTFDFNTGKTNISKTINSINDCIGLILCTGKGELLGDPSFGSRLYEMLYDLVTTDYLDDVKKEIIQSIYQFESRVVITENDIDIVKSQDTNNNRYTISIKYRLINSSIEANTKLTIDI